MHMPILLPPMDFRQIVICVLYTLCLSSYNIVVAAVFRRLLPPQQTRRIQRHTRETQASCMSVKYINICIVLSHAK